MPTGRVDALWVAAARDAALGGLIDEQIGYHAARRTRSLGAAHWLATWGERLFVAVLVIVLVKLGLLWGLDIETGHQAVLDLGLAGAIVPALSAALFGVRSYTELEMLAEQSKTMLIALHRARQQLQSLAPAAPLASQALGKELAALAILMLEELDGWNRMFREKVVGA